MTDFPDLYNVKVLVCIQFFFLNELCGDVNKSFSQRNFLYLLTILGFANIFLGKEIRF